MIGHETFTVIREPDGRWRAHCKTCDWVGEPHSHMLDTSMDSVQHTRETTEAAA